MRPKLKTTVLSFRQAYFGPLAAPKMRELKSGFKVENVDYSKVDATRSPPVNSKATSSKPNPTYQYSDNSSGITSRRLTAC